MGEGDPDGQHKAGVRPAEYIPLRDFGETNCMRDPRDTYQNQLVPMVVEQTNRGERAYDIYSRLFTS